MSEDVFPDPAPRPLLSITQTGLLVGLVLGVVAGVWGFTAFLVTLVLGAIGGGVGLVLDGRLDVRGLVERGRRR